MDDEAHSGGIHGDDTRLYTAGRLYSKKTIQQEDIQQEEYIARRHMGAAEAALTYNVQIPEVVLVLLFAGWTPDPRTFAKRGSSVSADRHRTRETASLDITL